MIGTLRVSQHPTLGPPLPWRALIPMPGGAWPSITMSSAYYNGNTYIGYGDPAGNMRVASYNHATHAVTISPPIVSGLDSDTHNAPSVLVRQSDHKIVIAIGVHATGIMLVAISTNAEDVSAWGSATNINSSIAGLGYYNYANLFQLSGESGKIYLFYRGNTTGAVANGHLAFSTSTDGGATWAAQTDVYVPPSGKAGYWSIDSDSTNRIDFAVTSGTVFDDTSGDLYHFYYTGGSYYKSDGTLITAGRPYGASNLTQIYDGTTNGFMSNSIEISCDGPTVSFTAANTGGYVAFPINLWYSRYSAGWTPHNFADTNFAGFDGGVTLDRSDTSNVFAGRYDAVQAQMWLYTTSDGGTTWTSQQLTDDTDQINNAPVSPRDADAGLTGIWVHGPQAPYTTVAAVSFTVDIRGYPN